jgi:hypothetical protein
MFWVDCVTRQTSGFAIEGPHVCQSSSVLIKSLRHADEPYNLNFYIGLRARLLIVEQANFGPPPSNLLVCFAIT